MSNEYTVISLLYFDIKYIYLSGVKFVVSGARPNCNVKITIAGQLVASVFDRDIPVLLLQERKD